MKITELVKKSGVNLKAAKEILVVLGKSQEFGEAEVEVVKKVYAKAKSQGVDYQEAYNQLQGIRGFNSECGKGANETAQRSTSANVIGMSVQQQQAANFVQSNILNDALALHAAYPYLFLEAFAAVPTDPRYASMIEASWEEVTNAVIQSPEERVQHFLLEGSSTFSSEPLLLTGSEER